jgi:HTH-type transcriptional regulator, sugar sensing transcriptional regulator
MNMDQIHDRLKNLGFTEYEAKIYVALLQSSPANGNIIAKNAGVPPSKVYEALRRMEEKKMVFPVSGGENGNKRRYSPVPYDILLSQKRKDFADGIKFLETSLEEVSNRSDTEWTELFVIDGYDSTIEAMQSAIESSKTKIMMTCWCRELEPLIDVLKSAYERGVAIMMLTFDVCSVEVPWNIYIHHQLEPALNRHIGELCLVIDNEKSIVFQSNEKTKTHAVISQHPSTVLIASNYIRHDILLNKLVQDMEPEIKQRFGSVSHTYISDL